MNASKDDTLFVDNTSQERTITVTKLVRNFNSFALPEVNEGEKDWWKDQTCIEIVILTLKL